MKSGIKTATCCLIKISSAIIIPSNLQGCAKELVQSSFILSFTALSIKTVSEKFLHARRDALGGTSSVFL
jgi:cell fate regulator YaaT (PSP1 superfamily)